MPNKKTPLSEKKQSMLAELESIKIVTIESLQSLSDLAALSDKVQTELVKDPYEENTKTHSEGENVPNIPPGQQALFKEPETTKDIDEAEKRQHHKTKSTRKPTDSNNTGISSDNPFLPEHIRHRLNSYSGLILEEPLITAHQKPSAQPIKEPQTQSTILQQQDSEQIIDRLVAQYLPKIELELRKELYEKLSTMTKAHQ